MIDLVDWLADSEGEERHALIIKDDFWRDRLAKWKAAYDLVASEDTLIVEKVNGEWPLEVRDKLNKWGAVWVDAYTASELLDALLAQQGTTK